MIRWIAIGLFVFVVPQKASPKSLEGATVDLSGNLLKITNHSGDPWVEMHIAVTERDKFDDASAYVCWGDRLDADETLTTKIDECTNLRGKKFGTLKPRLAAVSAHVPEHGLERSVFTLKSSDSGYPSGPGGAGCTR